MEIGVKYGHKRYLCLTRKRKIMRTKKELSFWTITDMIEYAKEQYPFIKKYFEWEDSNYEASCNRQIRRTLFAHQIIHKDNKVDKKYLISEIVAKFFVDVVLKEYFSRDEIEVRRSLNEEEAYFHKIFTEKDKKLNDNRDLALEIQTYELMSNDPAYDPDYTAQDIANELKSLSPDYHALSTGAHIHKSLLEYHVPLEDTCDRFIDKVIDRMMLRIVFDTFYDFNEKQFRIDYFERQQCILDDSSSIEYLPGYSELTYKLEHPLEYYISPKNKKDGNRK